MVEIVSYGGICGNEEVKLYKNHDNSPRKPPVIAVQGMWATNAKWKNLGEDFAKRGNDFITPTLPHHRKGNDEDERLGRLSVMDYVRATVGTIDWVARNINPLPPILIGHSMGGLICQVASALRSGKISGLILLCSAPPKGVSLHKDLDYTMKILRYLPKLLFKKPFKPSFEIASRYIMNRIPEEKRWGLYEAMVCESGRAAYEIASGKIEVNEAAITCPVYVIGCAEDRIIPPEVARDLFKKYSSISGKSKRTIFYGHGHWPHYEKGWETTAQVIHEWIESISA